MTTRFTLAAVLYPPEHEADLGSLYWWLRRLGRVADQANEHAPEGSLIDVVCLTTPGVASSVTMTDVRFETFNHGWPSKLKKLEVFRPGLYATSRVLYCDLDNEIIGSLEPLTKLMYPWVARDGARPNLRGSVVQSSVMWFSPGICTGIYGTAAALGHDNLVKRCPLGRGGGDQLFLDTIERPRRTNLEVVLPGFFLAYPDWIHRGRPKRTAIIGYHGTHKRQLGGKDVANGDL